MRRLRSTYRQRVLDSVTTLVAWAGASIAGLAVPIAIAAAALFLAGVLPGAQAEAATVSTCNTVASSGGGDDGRVCMKLVEIPDVKTPFGSDFNRAVTFSAGWYHWNVRTKNGAQTDICGTCAWTFYAKPGASYTFSVQGCDGSGFIRTSSCGNWHIFHYKTEPVLQVITVPQPPVVASPQILPLPDKGKSKAGDYAVKEFEALPGTGKGKSAGDYALKDTVGKQGVDLVVASLTGPGTLKAGLSGTYTVSIKNAGTVSATVELHVIFAKALDQTGQIVAGGGLACAIGHDAGINTGLTCTGGQVAAGWTLTVTVQGRGQNPGAGVLLATLNPSHAVAESDYSNNLKQIGVTIN